MRINEIVEIDTGQGEVLTESLRQFRDNFDKLAMDADLFHPRVRSIQEDINSLYKELTKKAPKHFPQHIHPEHFYGASLLSCLKSPFYDGDMNLNDFNSMVSMALKSKEENKTKAFIDILRDIEEVMNDTLSNVDEKSLEDPEWETVLKDSKFTLIDAQNFAAVRKICTRYDSRWCTGASNNLFIDYMERYDFNYILILHRTNKTISFHFNRNASRYLITGYQNKWEVDDIDIAGTETGYFEDDLKDAGLNGDDLTKMARKFPKFLNDDLNDLSMELSQNRR